MHCSGWGQELDPPGACGASGERWPSGDKTSARCPGSVGPPFCTLNTQCSPAPRDSDLGQRGDPPGGVQSTLLRSAPKICPRPRISKAPFLCCEFLCELVITIVFRIEHTITMTRITPSPLRRCFPCWNSKQRNENINHRSIETKKPSGEMPGGGWGGVSGAGVLHPHHPVPNLRGRRDRGSCLPCGAKAPGTRDTIRCPPRRVLRMKIKK